jgi:hypothetical protein
MGCDTGWWAALRGWGREHPGTFVDGSEDMGAVVGDGEYVVADGVPDLGDLLGAKPAH